MKWGGNKTHCIVKIPQKLSQTEGIALAQKLGFQTSGKVLKTGASGNIGFEGCDVSVSQKCW